MRKRVCPEERLAVTIRYLATGNSFTSLHYEYLLEISTIRSIKVALQLYEKTHFSNCVGAVDGKHVRIANPSNAGSQYFNYKHFFYIILLGLVDADYCLHNTPRSS
ncbi:hypothetical protein PR048_010248 [Dryococelus australis]|uniref:DDE Tnp4 domain-containing protein n=1 Tax=Dryococelus australis TaxID=614101 RepID=A0ABQ9I3B4_9NEOP|nr:hypothetical protein PR048_010248 [Dryococelus australis]